MEFKDRKVLVVGAARSGVSAARMLNKLGTDVTLADSKDRDKLAGIIPEMENLGVKLCIGKNAGPDLVGEQSLIVSSPGVPPWIETFETARKMNIPIMGEMELAFSLCPCPVAAITGTNGKTTTASLAGEIIASSIKDTRIVGNIGSPFSDCVLSLNEHSFAVLEASSFQLEDVSIFRPKISVILNITPDHLDRHKTMEKYIEAKTNIFKYTDKSCYVILNREDTLLGTLSINTGAKTLYFSVSGELSEGACLKNDILTLIVDGKETALINKNELKILGLHNVENALAASLAAFCAGIPPDTIAESLRKFKGVPHRIEFVRELNGVRYFNDSKGTNPDASIKALNAMRGKTVLIAGGYDKNADFNEIAALFNSKLTHLVALGKTREKIIDACEKAGFSNYSIADDYESAVFIASEKASENDSENVLLSPACASWDMFSDFEERGEHFKNLVNAL